MKVAISEKVKFVKICVQLSVTVRESVPLAISCCQPIWLKLGTDVGCKEIFQNPLWLTSLTFSFRVSGGVSFFFL